MEAVHGIRHLVLAEGWGDGGWRAVSRNTVRRYLAGAEPGARRPAERARPVFASVRSRIDLMNHLERMLASGWARDRSE